MLAIAIAYFKRHPAAKAVHIVLDQVFDSLATANSYKKAVNATTVTSYLREEYEAATQPPDDSKKSTKPLK